MAVLPTPHRSRVPRTFQSFRTYNYRLYWIGLTVSLIGTWLQTVGQAWLVLDLTGSPFALGMVIALQFLPFLFLSLPAGAIVDRLPKRRLILMTQTCAMTQALVIGVLVATGTIELWHIYVLAGLLGLNNSIDNPARQAFLSELVSRDNLPNAVGLNSTLFNTARIVGPAIGGLVIAAVGVASCFLLNSLSFAAVLGCLLLMRPSELHAPAARRAGRLLAQIAEGLRFVRGHTEVLQPLLLLLVIGTFGYNFNVALPLLARYSLDASSVEFGLLTSAMGLGSLIGALIVATLQSTSWRRIAIAAAAFSVLLGGVAASGWYPATLVLLACLGLAGILFTTGVNTTLQLHAPGELRGRVMSLYIMVFAGSTPIGGAFTGALADRVGIQWTLGIEAAICGSAVIGLFLYRQFGRPVDSPAVAAGTIEAVGSAGGGRGR